MKKICLLILLLEAFFTQTIYAQIKLPKVNTTSYGISFGLNQGRYTFIDAGFEKYWQQVKISKPRTTAFSVTASVNPFKQIGGISSQLWTRNSRFGLTYGASAGIFSDFEDNYRAAIGPVIGFRLLRVHAQMGYNFLPGNKSFSGLNTLYGSVRYYIPLKKDISIK